MSIRWKLSLYLALFTACMILVLFIFQTFFLGDFYRMMKFNELETAAAAVRGMLGQSSLNDTVNEYCNRYEICMQVFNATYEPITQDNGICHSGNLNDGCFIHSRGLFSRSAFLTWVKNECGGYFYEKYNSFDRPGIQRPTDKQPDNTDIVYLYVETAADSTGAEYFIVINTRSTPVNATVRTLQVQLLIVSVVFILLAVLMALLLSRGISSPIIRINRSAKKLASGDYETTFEGGGCREVEQLSETLNYATGELKKTDALQKELIANISHDLRTPLTMINGYAEVMRDIPGENTPENMQIIIDEATRLSVLVNDILDLSRLQANVTTLNSEPFSLTACVRSIIARYARLTENDGYHILFEANEEVFVYADQTKIQQVLYNLINNAISYTGDDKTVRICQTVSPSPSASVRIEVIDTGCGISKENLSLIWDRYYKENKAHKRAVVGTGLGLSIVKNILELHHARYGVQSDESPESHGSCFWFELPCVNPQDDFDI